MESSKGFYKGSMLSVTVFKHECQKSMESNEYRYTLMKSTKICEMHWKSSDNEKPAWNRAKVSKGQQVACYRFQTPMPKKYENL